MKGHTDYTNVPRGDDGTVRTVSKAFWASAEEPARLEALHRMYPRDEGEPTLDYAERLAILAGLIEPLDIGREGNRKRFAEAIEYAREEAKRGDAPAASTPRHPGAEVATLAGPPSIPRCDGNHAMPACPDPECWNRDDGRETGGPAGWQPASAALHEPDRVLPHEHWFEDGVCDCGQRETLLPHLARNGDEPAPRNPGDDEEPFV